MHNTRIAESSYCIHSSPPTPPPLTILFV
jgi:hypothetical protein